MAGWSIRGRGLYLASLFVLSACVHSQTSPALIGTVIPPYPEGMAERFGACIGTENPWHVCDYSVGVMEDARGRPLVVLAARFQKLDESGKAQWLVTDTLPYPHTKRDRALLWSTCIYKQAFDRSVLAVVDSPVMQAKPVKDWAYRVDLTTGKFVKLDPVDVACYAIKDEDS